MARDFRNGLTDAEVERSRKKHGDNVLTPPEKDSIWKQFLEKFSDPIIRILLIALLLSVAVSLYQLFTGAEGLSVLLEPLGIFVAVMLATTVGFVFELSANKKFDILNQAEDEKLVTVFRNGLIHRIERKDVVVGDTVVLNTGDEVPADGTLREAISLRVNESDLTGEPSCSKTTDKAEFKDDATYPSNYVCRGSSVMEGHGIFVVEKVGDATEWGKVYRGAQIDNKIKTPLNEQLDKLGKGITIASYVIADIIVVLRILMYFLYPDGPFDWMDFARYFLNTLMIAVTLIVVAVPEGLPMSVTLSLALSMKRMLETNNLVRKMHACETMGAATVICSDKTGTLTKNRMSLGDSLIYGLKDGQLDETEVSRLMIEGISVNSTAFLDYSDQQKAKVIGNPTEGALLLWLFDNNVDFVKVRDDMKIVKQLPFTTKYKYMATVAHNPFTGEYMLYVKGAPEILIKRCATVLKRDGEAGIHWVRSEVDEKLLEYQNKAMRTLGFAFKRISKSEVDTVFANGKLQVEDLCFLGIVGIIDPIRDDVADSVKDCLNAGISIKIVTGDTPGTAREIGRQVGLWTDADDPERQMITGKEFNLMTDDELRERVGDLKIMSRARPSDKERLVRLLQERGDVVAVTGHQRRPGLEPSPNRPFDGRPHLGGQGSQRHHHPRQLVQEHRPRRDVGTLALSQHPAVYPVPNDHQRGGLPHRVAGRSDGHRVAAHCDPDAVDQPHHGYLRCHGLGVVAARPQCAEGQAAFTHRLYHHQRDGRPHLRCGTVFCGCAVWLHPVFHALWRGIHGRVFHP